MALTPTNKDRKRLRDAPSTPRSSEADVAGRVS